MAKLDVTVVAVLIVIVIGLNMLVSNTIIAQIPREKHIGEPAHMHQSADSAELTALRAEVEKSQDRIVQLKFDLLEAVEKYERLKSASPTVQSSSAPVQDRDRPSSGSMQTQPLQSNLPQSLPPSSSPAADKAHNDLPYILIAMNTVSRERGEYLNGVLDVITSQLPADPLDPLYQRIVVHVFNMNNPDKPHPAFDKAKARFASRREFLFQSRTEADSEPPGQSSQLTPTVRKQSRDLIRMLKAVADKSHYLFVMEDDFSLCPQALSTIRYLIHKARTHFSNWLTLKISYGFNGIVLKNGEDVRFFADYLQERMYARPPDHVWTEWAAGETPKSKGYKNGRPHLASRYNLLAHEGLWSSLRDNPSPNHAPCFEEMVYPILFEVEAFQPNECAHDDMQPCPPKPDPPVPFLNDVYRPPTTWIHKELHPGHYRS